MTFRSFRIFLTTHGLAINSSFKANAFPKAPFYPVREHKSLKVEFILSSYKPVHVGTLRGGVIVHKRARGFASEDIEV